MAISFRRPAGGGRAPGQVTPSGVGAPVHAASLPAPSADPADVVASPPVLAGSILVELFQYLEANTPRHPALAAALPVLGDAVAGYRTGRAEDPFEGARAVYAVIQQARAADPSIPEA